MALAMMASCGAGLQMICVETRKSLSRFAMPQFILATDTNYLDGPKFLTDNWPSKRISSDVIECHPMS